jgi:hypothetical protein
MKELFTTILFTLSLVLAPLAAFADVAPVDTVDCVGKKAGDSCTNPETSAAGKCKADTCTSAKPDGTSSSYSCLRCLPGSNDDGGCAIGKGISGPTLSFTRVGPWALAGLFSLAFVWRRRRRR